MNGPISTRALTRSGSSAAAMVAAPPAKECPTMTAGRPGEAGVLDRDQEGQGETAAGGLAADGDRFCRDATVK
ncbi:hypothetical protein [Sphaerimonospora thailandensis]|uniref:Uncharacterized protein n=1 Tax=Sphaerimonospora thailandensis TaxID=795644 RepID=A0A8J3RBQ1_9ACTN|nr:hypothetical protein [Sphaerimonospora thailandensis]GIH70917.1 hypothetical protein Mth01_31700 [Sphaerimonospora thailandensis]